MSRGLHPELRLDHHALARDLLADYGLLVEQGGLEAPHDQLRRFCLHLGYHFEHICKRQLGVRRFTREQFAQTAAELVRVFGGECEVVGSGSSPIVLYATEWPTPEATPDGPHPSLMVPEILAEVAARNFGYGKVCVRQLSGGTYELRAHLKENRHARLDDGIECTPESLPDAGELEHELLHQFERVRALREALRQTEQRFAALATLAPDGILSLDLEARCTYANDAGAHLVGYEPEELAGAKLGELVAAESYEASSQQYGRACAGEATDLFRITVVTRQGEERRLSMRMWPHRNHGRIVGVDCLARDVTERERTENALRRSEALYRRLVEMSPDGIFMLDPDGRITFVNRFVLDITGYADSELVGSHFGKVIAPESRDAARAMFERAMTDDAGVPSFQLDLVPKDGQAICAELSIAQMREDGRVVGLLGIARDVTKRREIELEVFQQYRTLSALNTIATTVSRSLDLKETLEEALAKVLEVTEFGGGIIFLFDPGTDKLRLAAARWLAEPFASELAELQVSEAITGRAVLTGEPVVVEDMSDIPGRHAELTARMGLKTYVAVPLVAHQQVVGVMGLGSLRRVRVSQELLDLLVGVGSQMGMGIQNARLFEQTQEQARTDGLTGLHNRQYLQELFEREVERAKRYGHSIAVFILDLDGLKAINDALGHRVGDEALRAVAEILRASVRACDIAARYGGDEFVVVMPESDAAGAEAAAKRLRDNLEAFNRTGQLSVPVTVSTGVATADPQAAQAKFEHLLDEADRAMYASRRRGRRETVQGLGAAVKRG